MTLRIGSSLARESTKGARRSARERQRRRSGRASSSGTCCRGDGSPARLRSGGGRQQPLGWFPLGRPGTDGEGWKIAVTGTAKVRGYYVSFRHRDAGRYRRRRRGACAEDLLAPVTPEARVGSPSPEAFSVHWRRHRPPFTAFPHARRLSVAHTEMTVGDLIDLLSACDRNAPVRQASFGGGSRRLSKEEVTWSSARAGRISACRGPGRRRDRGRPRFLAEPAASGSWTDDVASRWGLQLSQRLLSPGASRLVISAMASAEGLK